MPKTHKPPQPIIITDQDDTIAQALAPPDLPTYTINDAEQAYTLLTQHPITHHLQTQEDTLRITTTKPNNTAGQTIIIWDYSLHDPHIQHKTHQHIHTAGQSTYNEPQP